MAPGGGSQTVVDGLKKEFANIAQLQLLPDAGPHQQFLQGLMAGMQKYIVQDAAKAANITPGQPSGGAQQGQQGPGGIGGLAAPGAPGSPSMTPGQAGGGTPAPGGPPGLGAPGGGNMGLGGGMMGLAPQLTDPDELRRMMNQTVNVS